jgi:hypothetical protein
MSGSILIDSQLYYEARLGALRGTKELSWPVLATPHHFHGLAAVPIGKGACFVRSISKSFLMREGNLADHRVKLDRLIRIPLNTIPRRRSAPQLIMYFICIIWPASGRNGSRALHETVPARSNWPIYTPFQELPDARRLSTHLKTQGRHSA